MESLKIALIQMNTTRNKEENIVSALHFCEQAINENAKFILLPEVFNSRGSRLDLIDIAEKIPGFSSNPFLELAKQKKVCILLGSICQKIPNDNRAKNTSVLIDDTGKIKAKYDKMHLFDVEDDEMKIKESDSYREGEFPTLTDVYGVKLGMAVCYDLRFPNLFNYYSQHGAEIITVPSSFTRPTGEAHWEVLLRARAIENQCFILAPNQIGVGAGQVDTYGNSLVIDPWGKIIAKGSSDKEEVVTAILDFSILKKVRKKMPVLNHFRKDIKI